jgi:5-methylcytosine-specific restriction protein A
MPKAQSRWHHLYCTTMWRKRAKHQLRSQPLCEVCLKDGRIHAATIADHVEPHKGDQQKFFFGELQSLCKLHHESAKKREEWRGYSTQIGADGWPVDPRHPVYSRGRGHKIFLRSPQIATASATEILSKPSRTFRSETLGQL